MFLTNSKDDADKVRKWSTQSRENAPWYEHEEVGYNYRMSNMIAGFIRGQIPYLQTHIDQKKAIYERYNREWWEEIISGEYQNYYAKMYGKLDFCSLGFGLLCCSSI